MAHWTSGRHNPQATYFDDMITYRSINDAPLPRRWFTDAMGSWLVATTSMRPSGRIAKPVLRGMAPGRTVTEQVWRRVENSSPQSSRKLRLPGRQPRRARGRYDCLLVTPTNTTSVINPLTSTDARRCDYSRKWNLGDTRRADLGLRSGDRFPQRHLREHSSANRRAIPVTGADLRAFHLACAVGSIGRKWEALCWSTESQVARSMAAANTGPFTSPRQRRRGDLDAGRAVHRGGGSPRVTDASRRHCRTPVPLALFIWQATTTLVG